MGNAIIMGSGKTPPPNSVEIEVTAAEDIKAGEFVSVGFNSSDESTVTQNSFTLPDVPSSIYSNKEPDGIFFVGNTSGNYLMRINEDGTVDIGTTIELDSGDTGAILQMLRYDDVFVAITSKKYYLFSLQDLQLTKITSTTPQKNTVNGLSYHSMYDVNNRIFYVYESNSGSSAIQCFYRFTDTDIIFMEQVSYSRDQGAVGSKQTSTGYKIAVARSDYTNSKYVNIDFYTCNSSFSNLQFVTTILIGSDTTTNMRSLFVEDELYCVVPYTPSLGTPRYGTYRIKIDWENNNAELIETSAVKESLSRFAVQHFTIAGASIVLASTARSNFTYKKLFASMFPNVTFNDFTYEIATDSADSFVKILFISNTKMIIVLNSKLCYVLDLLSAYTNQISGNSIVKTTAAEGASGKVYIKSPVLVTYFIN